MNPRMKFLRRYIIGSVSSTVDTFDYLELTSTKLETILYTGDNPTPTVPDQHSGKDVVWVGVGTFSGNTDVTSVTISKGITDIK